MPLLDIWGILEDPAWLTFGIFAGLGVLGLGLLFFLYPFAPDE
jgi:hypothetical protein